MGMRPWRRAVAREDRNRPPCTLLACRRVEATFRGPRFDQRRPVNVVQDADEPELVGGPEPHCGEGWSDRGGNAIRTQSCRADHIRLAQRPERLSYKQDVGGSRPSLGTNMLLKLIW